MMPASVDPLALQEALAGGHLENGRNPHILTLF